MRVLSVNLRRPRATERKRQPVSNLTWLDSSEHDRRRALEVIDLFRVQTTRDELGIGTVRDAIAEVLEPGLSTIQTRARYFLSIPWVYLRLERLRCSSADVARKARSDELRVARALAASADPEGTIGIEAGSALQRLPSAIYWGGLGVLGIRLFPGSQDQYHRSLDAFHRTGERRVVREDPEGEILGGGNWHPHLPEPPDSFLDELSLALTEEEALYLQDRFEARTPGSLAAFLSRAGEPLPPTRFFWDDALLPRYPSPLRAVVEHARCFSEVMHGAALLYNLMLAEALPREEWIEDYRTRIAAWQAAITDRLPALRDWDRPGFWRLVRDRNPRLPVPTQHFVTTWMHRVLELGELDLGTPAQRKLIADREFQLKRRRSRLQYREYLQMWTGAAGAEPLQYRWGTTQRVVNDILRGLHGGVVDARAA